MILFVFVPASFKGLVKSDEWRQSYAASVQQVAVTQRFHSSLR